MTSRRVWTCMGLALATTMITAGSANASGPADEEVAPTAAASGEEGSDESGAPDSSPSSSEVELMLELSMTLLENDEVEAAILLLDRAIAAEPDNRDAYLRRAHARELAATRYAASVEIGSGRGEPDHAEAAALYQGAADDLERFATMVAASRRDRRWYEARIARLRDLAAAARRRAPSEVAEGPDAHVGRDGVPIAGAGSPTSEGRPGRRSRRVGDLEDEEAIRTFHFRRRLAGGITGGLGVTTTLVGFALLSSSFRAKVSTDGQCLDACKVRFSVNPGTLVGGGVAILAGAIASGVGVGMIVRNPRFLRTDVPNMELRTARATARTYALREVGTGFVILGAVSGVLAATFAVISAQRYGQASIETDPTRAEVQAVSQAANTSAGLAALAPTMAAIGAGMRTAVIPKPPPVRASPVSLRGGAGVAVSGRF